eukprot:gb/GEZN01002937.1/.p1 GENE.gb/GEZN01002937.1/~~gb/GEZN01002937.1/.p1  ORF type:complete len:472 (-),score=82.98 gb/GEZN01002937.1/:857-2272(-)
MSSLLRRGMFAKRDAVTPGKDKKLNLDEATTVATAEVRHPASHPAQAALATPGGPRLRGRKEQLTIFYNILIIDKHDAVDMGCRKMLEKYGIDGGGYISWAAAGVVNQIISEETIAGLLAPIFEQELPKLMMRNGVSGVVKVCYRSDRFFVLKMVIDDLDARFSLEAALPGMEAASHSENTAGESPKTRARRLTDFENAKKLNKFLDITTFLEEKGGFLGKVTSCLLDDGFDSIAWRSLKRTLELKVPVMMVRKFKDLGMDISCHACPEKDQLAFFNSTLARFSLSGASPLHSFEDCSSFHALPRGAIADSALSGIRNLEKEEVGDSMEVDGEDDEYCYDLKVVLVRAENLPIMDIKSSDPYLKIASNRQKHRSSVKKRTLNPVWNEEFVLAGVDFDELITFTLMDQDPIFDEKMGSWQTSVQELEKTDDPTELSTLSRGLARKEVLQEVAAEKWSKEVWFDVNSKKTPTS